MGLPTFDYKAALLYLQNHPIEAISSAILVTILMWLFIGYAMPMLTKIMSKEK